MFLHASSSNISLDVTISCHALCPVPDIDAHVSPAV